MSYLADAAAIAGKDLRIELRARHATAVTIPFVATLVLAFGLTFGGPVFDQNAAGLLWFAAFFATVLTCARAQDTEDRDDAGLGLVLAPVEKSAVFIGKAAALAVQLLGLELVLLVLVVLVLRVPAAHDPAALVVTLVLGACGLAAQGTLLGSISGVARTRESVLHLLVFPTGIPLLIATTSATAGALSPAGGRGPWSWIELILAFDVVFVCAGVLLFGHTLED